MALSETLNTRHSRSSKAAAGGIAQDSLTVQEFYDVLGFASRAKSCFGDAETQAVEELLDAASPKQVYAISRYDTVETARSDEARAKLDALDSQGVPVTPAQRYLGNWLSPGEREFMRLCLELEFGTSEHEFSYPAVLGRKHICEVADDGSFKDTVGDDGRTVLYQQNHIEFSPDELAAIEQASYSALAGMDGKVEVSWPQHNKLWYDHIHYLHREVEAGNPITVSEYYELLRRTHDVEIGSGRSSHLAVGELTVLCPHELTRAYGDYWIAERKRAARARQALKRIESEGRAITDGQAALGTWGPPEEAEFMRLCLGQKFGIRPHKLWSIRSGGRLRRLGLDGSFHPTNINSSEVKNGGR